MKRIELKNYIKNIVRENLDKYEYAQLLKEVSPPGAKAERMIQHVKSSLRDKHPNWSDEKITSVAIATAWKAHNKGSVEQEQVGADVVAGENTNEAGLTSESPEKWIGKAVDKSHAGYCTPMTKSTCTPRRKALAKRFKKGLEEMGYRMVKESEVNMKMGPSYKVAPPRSYTDAERDRARTIQYDPEVTSEGNDKYKNCPGCGKAIEKDTDQCNKCREGDKERHEKSKSSYWNPSEVDEASYKTQGSSLRTFKDSPQFPEYRNDPKIA